ncbi:MAG TPA: hypothetical protein PLP05_00080 [Sedimentisphaerales bacterium]|nr:hypothetical protein [Sedimentisphaerales bacterium]
MDNKDKKIEEMLKRYKLPDAPAELKARIFQQKKKKINQTILAVAATILIAATTTTVWQVKLQPTTQETNNLTLAQAKLSITRAAQAAQLLTVADIFANQAGGEEHAKKLYCEIADSFPDFNAGIQAQLKLKKY